MKLTMLGTGNALVTKCYNTCFVLSEGNQHFLVDGGGGNTVLSQLEKANIDFREIHHIFITHKHIDHLLGIIWMVRMICQNMRQNNYEGDAYIYGHDEVIDLVKTISMQLISKKDTKYIDDRLHLVKVFDGQSKSIIGSTVTFFDIGSTKAKQFGFKMTLENGKVLTCCGDEPYNECEKQYAINADWLLHEAFCLFHQADIFKPYEKHHSTAKDAAILAEQLNVKNLVLYHTEDKNIENRKKLYTEEANAYFKGNVYVPCDLESFEL